MKISRMNKGSWGKVRAFFDLETKDGFIIKGFKLIESDGLFVGFPSEKDKEGKYNDTVFANKALKQEVNKLAHDYYHNEQPVKSEDVPTRRIGGMSDVDYDMRNRDQGDEGVDLSKEMR